MTAAEITEYSALPSNLPENNLKAKEKEFVSSLYYKYVGRPIDVQSYGPALYKREMKETWPSGPRMKAHEAQRIILSNLIELQTKKTLTHARAASMFHSALTCRQCYTELVAKVYSCID